MIEQIIEQLIQRSQLIQQTKDEAILIEKQQGDSLEFLVKKLSHLEIDTAYIENVCRLVQLSNNTVLIELTLALFTLGAVFK